MLRSSLERQFDKTNFISPKRTPPKSPHHLGLKDQKLFVKEAKLFFHQKSEGILHLLFAGT